MKNLSKKKVLYLYCAGVNENRAAINQLLNTINSLSKYWDIHYIIPWISNLDFVKVLEKYQLKKQFHIIKVPVFFVGKIFPLFVSQFFYSLFSFFFFTKKYDYIYTRDFSVIYFLSFIPKYLRPKIPIIFESHKIFHKTSKIVSFKQEQRAYKIVDYFVATSNNCKEDLEKYFSILGNNIVVTPNGVDIKHFEREDVNNSILSKYNLKENNKILVYHGSFLWWKGVDDLVKSLHYIKDLNIKLLLIGGYGKDFDEMKELVRKEELEERVVFTGYLDHGEMIDLLYLSDIGILPNNKSEEGERYTSPVKLYEYMVCGLPVIASSLPSIKEIIKEPRNCLFFEPENQKDLAWKVENLLSNKGLIAKMSQNNKKDVLKYTWDKKARKIDQFLENQKSENF